MRITTAVAVVCAAIGALSIVSAADAAIKHYELNIPREPLDGALKDLAQQTGLQVGRFNDAGKGETVVGPLNGRYSADDALKSLLDSTGLAYRALNDRAYIVATPGELPTAKAQSAEQDTVASQGSTKEEDAQKPGFWDRFRLAQADQTAAGPEVGAADKQEPTQLQEVVVTGSYLKGVEPVSPVLTISREEIEQSGLPNVGTYLQSLPQDFGGGNNFTAAGAFGVGGYRDTNVEPSTANLRGLGPDATLTLVDGHRLGNEGQFEGADLSIIPMAAVQRIEVATDGASAIYGSDAVAGVVNVILRKDYDGAETQVTGGGTSGGGGTQQQYSQIVGKNFGSGNAVVAYEFAKNDPLLASDRSISSGAMGPFDLLPEQKRNSFFTAESYRFSSGLSARLEGLYTTKSTDTLENDFGTVTDTAGSTHQYGIDGGLDFALPRDGLLSLDLDAAGNRQVINYSQDSGTGVTQLPAANYDSRVRSAEVMLQSPSFDIPTGQLRFAVGGGYRREYLDGYAGSTLQGSWSRGIAYEFGELNVPLVRKSTARTGLERLDLDASVRHEQYSQVGDTTNPRIGIVYTPVQDISVKGSWGTSFRAPALVELNQPFESSLYPASFWGPPAPSNSTVFIAFGPTDLKPETSRSWTTSLQYQPVEHPNFSATLTYYSISFDDRITQPFTNQLAAFRDPSYAPFVIYHPSAQLQQYWAQGFFFNNTGLPYDPSNVYALLQDSLANVSSQKISGVDALTSYRWDSRIGHWAASANASWLDFVQRLIAGTPEQRINGTVFNPPTWKGRASLAWNLGPWSAVAFVNYVSSETDNTAVPPVRVSSWTTCDAQLAYDLKNARGLLHGLALRVSVQNVFNREPPALQATTTFPPGVGFDAANYSGLGRMTLVTLTKAW